MVEELSEEKEELPEMLDDPKARQLRQYHQVLELATTIVDSEDQYQAYFWKVDKILSHKRRGKQIFLHVKWKPGNHSWISL